MHHIADEGCIVDACGIDCRDTRVGCSGGSCGGDIGAMSAGAAASGFGVSAFGAQAESAMKRASAILRCIEAAPEVEGRANDAQMTAGLREAEITVEGRQFRDRQHDLREISGAVENLVLRDAGFFRGVGIGCGVEAAGVSGKLLEETSIRIRWPFRKTFAASMGGGVTE